MPLDYSRVESLFSALDDGAVALLKATWLIARAESGTPLVRRQELPKEAFMSVAELKRMHEKSKAIVMKGHRDEWKPAPIVAVSHFWRTPAHPDPEGETLANVAKWCKHLLTARFSSGSTCKEMGWGKLWGHVGRGGGLVTMDC